MSAATTSARGWLSSIYEENSGKDSIHSYTHGQAMELTESWRGYSDKKILIQTENLIIIDCSTGFGPCLLFLVRDI